MIRAPRPRVLAALLTLLAFVLSLVHVRVARAEPTETQRAHASMGARPVASVASARAADEPNGDLVVELRFGDHQRHALDCRCALET